MKRKLIFGLLGTLFFSGCCFFHRSAPAPIPVPPLVKSHEIFQKGHFRKGGKILIEPFLAGENVVASDELDRLALRVVQKISEVLKSETSGFQVLNAQNSSEGTLIVKGHFTRLTVNQPRPKWVPGGHQQGIAVDVDILDAKSGDLLAKIHHERESSRRDVSLDAMATGMGDDIARFLVTLSEQK